MDNDNSGSKFYEEDFEVDLRDCEFLGEGNNGIVYLMPDGNVIKICKEPKKCKKEYDILEKVKGSKHFPRVFLCGGNYMVREYVKGQGLKSYIRKNGMTRELAVSIGELIEEFGRLGFTKLDCRCRDIYIQEDGNLMVIDPRSSFRRVMGYPRHMMKGLKKLGVLDEFVEIIKKEKPHLYRLWEEARKKPLEDKN